MSAFQVAAPVHMGFGIPRETTSARWRQALPGGGGSNHVEIAAPDGFPALVDSSRPQGIGRETNSQEEFPEIIAISRRDTRDSSHQPAYQADLTYTGQDVRRSL